jgi:hypothetical protein
MKTRIIAKLTEKLRSLHLWEKVNEIWKLEYPIWKKNIQ